MKKIIKSLLVISMLIAGVAIKGNKVNAVGIEGPIYHPHIEYDMNLKKNTSSSFNRKEASGDLEINYKEEYENLYFDLAFIDKTRE